RDGFPQQVAFGAITAIFLWSFARRSRVPRLNILCAVLIATLAEMFLSLVWGLYSYKHFLIPLYVPPGHGLFYMLAADTALQEPLRRRTRAIVRSVLGAGTLV